jgi:hypothetical protein
MDLLSFFLYFLVIVDTSNEFNTTFYFVLILMIFFFLILYKNLIVHFCNVIKNYNASKNVNGLKYLKKNLIIYLQNPIIL